MGLRHSNIAIATTLAIIITFAFSLTASAADNFRIVKAAPLVSAQLAESLAITGVSQAQNAFHLDGKNVGILVIDDWSNLHGGSPHGQSVVEVLRATAPEADIWLCKLDFTIALMNDFTGCLREMETRKLPIDIVNMSFSMGDKFYSTACGNDLTSFGRAIHDYAKEGILFIAASGNQGAQNGLRFPSCHTDVISVAATYDADGSSMVFQSSEFSCRDRSKLDQITCYSNIASYLDLLAPGTIVSTPSNNRFGGTSAAAPVVTGIVALMLSQDPGMNKSDVLRTLRDTGKQVYNSHLRKSFTRVDAYGALQRVVSASNARVNSNTNTDEADGITINQQSVANFDANQDGYIDDHEFFDVIESWIRKSISTALFFQLVDVWSSESVVATETPERVGVVLNSTPTAIFFRAQGEVDHVSLQIYNTEGRLISTQVESGDLLRWDLMNASGRAVANGVYLYVIQMERDGEITKQQGKVVVLR